MQDIYLNADYIGDGTPAINTGIGMDDPIEYRKNVGIYFNTHFPGVTKQIKEAASEGCTAIRIRNTQNKLYNIRTPYAGIVEPDGIEDLIFRIYGVLHAANAHPISYYDEDHNIIRAVAPRINSENERSSQSPHQDLDWHADAAYRPMFDKTHLSPMSDYLAFGIVNAGYDNIPITYITLTDIIKQLDEKHIIAGLSPEFVVQSSDSFSSKVLTENIPLLSHKTGDGAGFCSRITLSNATALTTRAQGFLDAVREITNQESMHNKIHLIPGEIIILNNKTTLHKRERYTPRWDGKDRYMIRIYASNNINQGIIHDPKKPWIWA